MESLELNSTISEKINLDNGTIEKINITKEFSENRFNNEIIIIVNKINEIVEVLNKG